MYTVHRSLQVVFRTRHTDFPTQPYVFSTESSALYTVLLDAAYSFT